MKLARRRRIWPRPLAGLATRVPAKERAALALAGLAALGVLVLAPAAPAAPPIALGVNLPDAPGDVSALEQYVAETHRAPAIVMWYQQFSEPLFYPQQMANLAPFKSIPMITWDPILDGTGIPLTAIAAGQYDPYLRQAARQAAALGFLVYVRFGHEMNVSSSAFGPGHAGDTPAAYRAAWRRVVSIFRQEGATNVQWVWSPNVNCDGRCPFGAYFPGERWVDWVALDGYNYGPVDHLPWESFSRIFAGSYHQLTRLTSKPVMIGETATTSVGGDKSSWIEHAFAAIPSRFPRVRAVIWFDRAKETDWQLDSSPGALRAWQRVVSTPRFTATPIDLLRLLPRTRDATHGLSRAMVGRAMAAR